MGGNPRSRSSVAHADREPDGYLVIAVHAPPRATGGPEGSARGLHHRGVELVSRTPGRKGGQYHLLSSRPLLTVQLTASGDGSRVQARVIHQTSPSVFEEAARCEAE